MAGNKGTRGLDQSTRDTLSALDWALEQSEKTERKANEFTSSEYHDGLIAKGVNIGKRAAIERLYLLVTKGVLTVRKITLKGSQTNLYSKP
jgi:hypothetical protein